jgi:orotidine-5'-phosphate decarboxylase
MSLRILKNPIIFSLDVSDLAEAEKWVEEMGDLVGCIKLGPRLLLKASKDWVNNVSQICPVFIDCKFFDIPSTMIASIETCFEMGASLVTVHSLCGKPTLKKLAELQKNLSNERPFLISPVTILTSVTEQDLTPNFKFHSIQEHVTTLMQIIADAGLKSLVCSPLEAQKARNLGLLPITPGIRADRAMKQDQNRTMSAKEALKAGAWGLVIGRPILQASNPKSWVSSCLKELGENI